MPAKAVKGFFERSDGEVAYPKLGRTTKRASEIELVAQLTL